MSSENKANLQKKRKRIIPKNILHETFSAKLRNHRPNHRNNNVIMNGILSATITIILPGNYCGLGFDYDVRVRNAPWALGTSVKGK